MKSRMKSAAVLIGLVVATQLTGCLIVSSGDWEAERRELDGPIRHITASGSANLRVIECGCSKLSVYAANSEHAGFDTTVNGDRLFVSGGGDGEVVVRTPALESLSLSGSADVVVEQFNGPELTITASGSNDVELHGRAGQLVMRLSGSSNIDASRLETKHVEIIASGSGDLMVCALESLNVLSSGSADIVYYCDPERVEITASGSGDIHAGF
jgi:hypothetical protein